MTETPEPAPSTLAEFHLLHIPSRQSYCLVEMSRELVVAAVQADHPQLDLKVRCGRDYTLVPKDPPVRTLLQDLHRALAALKRPNRSVLGLLSRQEVVVSAAVDLFNSYEVISIADVAALEALVLHYEGKNKDYDPPKLRRYVLGQLVSFLPELSAEQPLEEDNDNEDE